MTAYKKILFSFLTALSIFLYADSVYAISPELDANLVSLSDILITFFTWILMFSVLYLASWIIFKFLRFLWNFIFTRHL